MKKSIIALVFLLFITPTFFAQNNDFVIGLILNHKTLEPIPFATIYWEGKNFGITSNENGTFRIQIKGSKTANKLIIRCIGYETIKLSLKEISVNQLATFKLNEKMNMLGEVEIKGTKIKPLSAKAIVRRAVKNITNNYPTNPFLLAGYYRDYMKIDSQYLNMYESLIELEDRGFLESDYETSKIKQVYGRINNDFVFDTMKILSYSPNELKIIPGAEMGYKGGNELSILRFNDPIRNYEQKNFDFIGYLKKRLSIKSLF